MLKLQHILNNLENMITNAVFYILSLMLMILKHVIASTFRSILVKSKFIWMSHFICNHRLLKNFDLIINMYKYTKWHHKGQQYVIGTCGQVLQTLISSDERLWLLSPIIKQALLGLVLESSCYIIFHKKTKKNKQTNKQKTEEWYLARHLQRTLILEEAYICSDDHLGEQSCWYVHQDL